MKPFALFLGLSLAAMAHAATATINNPPGITTAWTDTSGNRIANNSGCVLQVGTTFYFYGYDPVSNTVNCYTSTTLGSASWTKVTGNGFPMFGSGSWHGRPDVIKHPTNGTYVMILEGKPLGSDPGRNAIDYYTATSPTGPFAFHHKDNQVKLNNTGGWVNMGDKGLYQDEDAAKTVYLLAVTDDNGVNNSTTKIVKMNADYLGQNTVVQSWTSPSPKREAMAMFKRSGTFYLFSSYTMGWSSSPTTYKTATSIAGTWSPTWMAVPTNPAGNGDSFNTQHDFILRIIGTDTTSYIYTGDRWGHQLNPSDPTKFNNNAWFPLTFDGNGVPTIKGDASWTINAVTGVINGQPQTLTFAPTKDAMVKEFSPTANYGTSTQMQVNANVGFRKQSFIQFTISGIPAGATVTGATLIATSQINGSAPITAYAVGNTTWSETGINWNNRPAMGASQSTDSSHSTGVDDTWNVTSHVITIGNNPITFGLNTTATGDTNYDTRESGVPANRPALQVTFQP